MKRIRIRPILPSCKSTLESGRSGFEIAIATVLTVTLAQLLIRPVMLQSVPYQLFSLAIIISALYGGFLPGLLCTVLSALVGNWLFVPPFGALSFYEWSHVVSFLTVLLSGIGISVIGNLRLQEICRTRALVGRLKATSTLLQTVSEAVPDPMFVKDAEGRILWANPAALKASGHTEEEVYGKRVRDIVPHHEEVENTERSDAVVMKAGETHVVEESLTGVAGKRVYLVSKTPIRDNDGTINGLVGVARDITDRKRMEDVLQESEERYRYFVRTSAQIVWVTNPLGEVTIAQPAWQAFTGQSEEEVRGFGWINAIRVEDRESVQRAWAVAVRTGGVFEAEYLLRRHDGEWRNISSLGVPILNREGKIREWMGTCHDITTQKNAETQLRKAREEAERGQRQADAILQSMAEGVMVSNLDVSVISMNPAALRLLGFDNGDKVRMHVSRYEELFEVFDEQGNALPREEWPLARAIRGDIFSDLVLRLRRIDQHREFWLSNSGTLVRDRTGTPILAIITFRDITAQYNAVHALGKSEAHLKDIIENLAEGLIVVTRDERVLHWNHKALELHGYTSHADALSYLERLTKVYQLTDMHGNFVPFEEWPIPKLMRAGELRDYELTVRDPSRNFSRVFCYGGTVVHDERGEPEFGLLTIRDITAKKRAEEALQEAQGQMRLILEAAPTGICYIDSARRIRFANHVFAQCFELQPAALIGKPLSEIVGEQAWREIQPWVDLAFTGKPVRYELVAKYSGDPRVIAVAYQPDVKNDGTVRGIVTVATDITELKRTESELARAKSNAESARHTAEEASHAKDHFLAVLSHELRTPLSPVLAAVQLIERRDGVSPQALKTLEVIRRNVELEARLIDDLLDLTRIVRGKITLERKPIEIKSVLQRVIEICRPEIDSHKLHLELHCRDNASFVDGDMARLQQVFWNLLKNAIKFTPEGGRISLSTWQEDNTYVVQVRDTGVGIEAEAQSRIFNAFEQEDTHTTRQFGGLGLGLAISKRLVEMHGGKISAHSEGRGKGATFDVRLPIATQKAPVIEDIRVKTEQRPAEPHEHHGKILLVEDHVDTAQMMQQLLEAAGYHVETAIDVKHGLAAIGAQSFDLLISDLGLPDQSGLELMRTVGIQKPGLKGIALSGYGRDEDVEKSKAAGFSAHLTKPVNFDKLSEVVDQLLVH